MAPPRVDRRNRGEVLNPPERDDDKCEFRGSVPRRTTAPCKGTARPRAAAAHPPRARCARDKRRPGRGARGTRGALARAQWVRRKTLPSRSEHAMDHRLRPGRGHHRAARRRRLGARLQRRRSNITAARQFDRVLAARRADLTSDNANLRPANNTNEREAPTSTRWKREKRWAEAPQRRWHGSARRRFQIVGRGVALRRRQIRQ